MQDRCMVSIKHTKDSEIILMHLMEPFGDVDHVESHFSPFGDSVSVGSIYVHSLSQTYHRLRNHFGRT
jgi:hypothetical protein